MSQDVLFDHENPVTVHDILWAWSRGLMSTKRAIASLHLDDEMELYEVANDNDIPYPGTPSQRDVDMAKAFIAAITDAA